MRVAETSGRTVDEAVGKALAQLGLRRDQVEIDVVTEGKAGRFGFGSEDAIVRVTAHDSVLTSGPSRGPRRSAPVRQRQPEAADVLPQRDDDDDDDDDDRDDDDAPRSEDGEAPAADGDAPRRRRRGRRGGRGRRRDDDAPAAEGGEQPVTAEAAPRAAAPAREGGTRENRGPARGAGGRGRAGGGGGRNDRGGRGAPRGGGREFREPREPREARPQGFTVPADEEVRIPDAPDELPTAPKIDVEDDLDLAGGTLRDVLNLLGLQGTEISARDPETPGDGAGLIAQVFDVYGEDDVASDELGLLIGRRGETLYHLQYLMNTIVGQRRDSAPVFGLDIEGYRRRREQMLVDMAREIAQEVRETGDVITLEPMPAHERRIIHLTLETEEGVRTESVGSGENRQVEILPAE
ncbi:MAG: protein jag [Dehalococcoidia bacterium]|nr:MAG: protein jag [Dehalococcoidia bacterium]